MEKISKKILISTLLLTLFLLTISTATAADIHMNTTNNTIANAVENQTTNDDTIYLDEGTYNHSHLNGTEGIFIDKNITIIGKGADKTIIDAQQQGRIFYIQSSGILTLINITLTNGNHTYGGAIRNYDGSLTVTGSTFNNNTANDGGAIYNLQGLLSINDTIFKNNNAKNLEGGAIVNENSNNSNISNCKFDNNTCRFSGGAISNINVANNSIINCTFTNNKAIFGLAISNENCENTSIINSNFTNNICTNPDDGRGVIILHDNNSIIMGCNIVNNDKGVYIYRISNITFNYNRIFNNTNYDLNYATGNNIDYNWWGSNTPDMTKIIGVIPNNYFVMNVINLTSLDSNGTVLFNYTFKLNDSSNFNADLLPFFVTDFYTNVTNEFFSDKYFDARFSQEYTAIIRTLYSNQDIKFIFVTDNEIQTLEGTITPTPTPEPPIPPEPTPTPDPVDPVDPVNPVDPADPVDPDTPDTPQPTNNETSNNSTAKAVMKETGIPINLILIAVLSILGVLIGKKH